MYFSSYGYDIYEDYLMGAEWSAIKNWYFKNTKKYECDICTGHDHIVLHKRSYKFLSLVELRKRYSRDNTKMLRYLHTYMVYLCRGCNRNVHFYPTGKKVPLEYRKLLDREKIVRKHTKKVVSKRFL